MTQDDPGQPPLGDGLRHGVPGAPVPPADHRPQGCLFGRRPGGARRLLPRTLRAEQPGRRRSRATSATAEARAAVERHFGAAPRSRLAPVLVPAEPLQLGPRQLHRYEKVEVARAALAWPIPGLTDPSAPVLDLLALVLGGGESSILWQEVREKRKLVHAIDASSWNPGSSGLFCITFTCDAGQARRPAEAAIVRPSSTALGAPGAFTAAPDEEGLPPVGGRRDQHLQDDERPGLPPRDGRGRRRRPAIQPRPTFERLAPGRPGRPAAGASRAPRPAAA